MLYSHEGAPGGSQREVSGAKMGDHGRAMSSWVDPRSMSWSRPEHVPSQQSGKSPTRSVWSKGFITMHHISSHMQGLTGLQCTSPGQKDAVANRNCCRESVNRHLGRIDFH